MSGDSKDHQTSLKELSEQIDAVYQHLMQEEEVSRSAISLESSDSEATFRTPRQGSGLPSQISGLCSSLRSILGSPLSADLPDYRLPQLNNRTVTNSSVDVVVEDSTPEPSYSLYSPYSDTRKLNHIESPAGNSSYATPEQSSSAIDEEDWSERGAAETVAPGPNGPTTIRRTVKDFEFGKDLGKGSYSTVVLATDKITKKQYAVKVLDKRHIIKEKKVKYVNIEKHALNRLSGLNGIISLFFTFQDKDSLYFVLDYASNGELLGLIKTYGSLSEDCTRHFGAQILEAVKNMHDNGIIHRDIKPENILIDDQLRIRVTDFGTAKLFERTLNDESGDPAEYPVDVRAKSFVGTAEYVSPELLESKYCGKLGDIWAYGCILYQLVAGRPPFKAANEYLTFQKITKLQYAFSAGFPLILRDLIKQILVLRPSRRATISQIQKHPFFEKCNFAKPSTIWNAKVPELTPYKMTAQSMMKMPPKAPPAKERKPALKKKSTSPRTTAARPTQARTTPLEATSKFKKPAEDKGVLNFTPASVAAYVLSKEEDTNGVTDKSTPRAPPFSLSLRSPNTPDYIPGTNILRPQVNTMANFSRGTTSGSNKSDSDQKKIRRPARELPPPTAIKAAWLQCLSPDERIIHVGCASASKKVTETFEKKYKGLIHDAPLGFYNQLKPSIQHSNSHSMLSRYVRDNHLRDTTDPGSLENESDAVIFNYEEVAVPPEQQAEEDEKNRLLGIGHGRFGKSLKKLLVTSDRKSDAVETIFENGSVTRQTISLERPRACTVLITNYGRVLLFLRDDTRSDYKLICEVRLKYPFIHIKEVLTTPTIKFGKQIPASGIFAIVSKSITFVFEVEKYEVNQWTEALATAKLYLIERDSQPEHRAMLRSSSSYELLDSPRLVDPVRSVSNGSEALLSRSPRSSKNEILDQNESVRSNKHAQKRIRRKELPKRRVHPSSLKSPTSALCGFVKDPLNGESATVHAAQLAVSNINVSPAARSSEHRTNSFTKETARSHKNLTAAVSGNITSINSKFLARSRGSK